MLVDIGLEIYDDVGGDVRRETRWCEQRDKVIWEERRGDVNLETMLCEWRDKVI